MKSLPCRPTTAMKGTVVAAGAAVKKATFLDADSKPSWCKRLRIRADAAAAHSGKIHFRVYAESGAATALDPGASDPWIYAGDDYLMPEDLAICEIRFYNADAAEDADIYLEPFSDVDISKSAFV